MNFTEVEHNPIVLFGWQMRYGFYDIAHMYLCLAYLLLTVYVTHVLVKLTCFGRESLMRWQKFFMLLVMFGGGMRTAWCIFAILLRESIVVVENQLMFLLNSAPAFLFYLCYLIVLFLWAEIYHTTNKQDLRDPSLKIRNLKPVFLTVSFLIWSAVVTLYILDFSLFESPTLNVSMHTNVIEMTIIVLISLLYVVTAFAFLIYGVRFYVELHRTGNSMFTVQSRRQHIVLEVQLITGVLSLCFIIRAALTIWQIFTTVALSKYYYADPLYFTFLELVPMSLLVIILRPRQAVPSYKVHSSFSPIINTSYQ